MHCDVHVSTCGADGFTIAHVRLEGLDDVERRGLAARPVVQYADSVASLDQRVDEAGTDEPAPAGHEHPHRASRPASRARPTIATCAERLNSPVRMDARSSFG